MNTDIRISVSFKNHRKRAKLRMILGDRSTDYLLDLWLSVAMDRPDGNLSGLDAMDIAIMAGWNSDPQVLVNALVEVGFLDVTTVERPLNGVTTPEYSLHDWCDHNGYASAATDRSDKSRFSRMAKTHPTLYESLKKEGYESITSAEYRRLTTVERPLTNRSSPSPLPLPSPLPSKEEEPEKPPVNFEDIRLAFNKFCPSLPNVREITSTRWMYLKKITEKYRNHEGGSLRFFDQLFKKVEASDFLSGRSDKGKWCSFDWIIKDDHYVQIIEGQYDNDRRGTGDKRSTGKAGEVTAATRSLNAGCAAVPAGTFAGDFPDRSSEW